MPFVVLFASLFAACATVPETGRTQLLLVSPQQEYQLGLSEFEKLKETTPASRATAIVGPAHAVLPCVG